MIKSTLKIARYCPLVIQGFSNFLGLFQGIMANPVVGSSQTPIFRETWHKNTCSGGNFLGVWFFASKNDRCCWSWSFCVKISWPQPYRSQRFGIFWPVRSWKYLAWILLDDCFHIWWASPAWIQYVAPENGWSWNTSHFPFAKMPIFQVWCYSMLQGVYIEYNREFANHISNSSGAHYTRIHRLGSIFGGANIMLVSGSVHPRNLT